MQPMLHQEQLPELSLPKPGKLSHPGLIVLAATLCTVLLMLGMWWLVAWERKTGSSGNEPEPEQRAPVQVEGAEKARFDSLLKMSDAFNADPAAGADAWAAYMRGYPRAPTSRRERASKMLDFYLNLDEARQKNKPAAKAEHLDF
jgi:hypothetical protein